MAEDRILKRWMHGRLECLLWTRGEGTLDGAVTRGGQVLVNVKLPDSAGEDIATQVIQGIAAALEQPRGIWNLDPEPFTDLVMVPLPGQLHGDEVERLRRPFAVARDISVIPVEGELPGVIYEACDPPGIGIGEGIDLRGPPLYAFARLNAPREPVYGWDPDERLQMCIALSRLVRPTSASFAYAVRLIGRLEARHYMVRPGPVRGFGSEAWTSSPEHDWLGHDDLSRLRELVAAFDNDPLPFGSRVSRAFWYFEYAARTKLLEIRYPLIATGLEGLLGTSGDRSTQQFVKRVPQLAEHLGLPPVSNAEARRMWGLRSALVHGQERGGLDADDFATYQRMEEMLRVCLSRNILDPGFRARFASAAAIDAAYPVTASPKSAKCPTCGATFELRV